MNFRIGSTISLPISKFIGFALVTRSSCSQTPHPPPPRLFLSTLCLQWRIPAPSTCLASQRAAILSVWGQSLFAGQCTCYMQPVLRPCCRKKICACPDSISCGNHSIMCNTCFSDAMSDTQRLTLPVAANQQKEAINACSMTDWLAAAADTASPQQQQEQQDGDENLKQNIRRSHCFCPSLSDCRITTALRHRPQRRPVPQPSNLQCFVRGQ